MILSTRQSTRFLRLFNLLIGYLRAEYRKANPADADSKSREDEIDIVCKYVWDEFGHLDLIDRFLEEHDAHLSSADKRAILAFKGGLYDTFPCARIGADTFFLLAGHAFAVRGIECEVDDVAEGLPCIARAVLLPFDGLITYGTVLVVAQFDDEDEVYHSVQSVVDDATENGHVIRSERDFMRVAPMAKEEAKALMQECESLEEELEDIEGTPHVGHHVGILAGLSWEERTQAIGEHRREATSDEQDADIRVSFVERVCRKGKPARTVADLFGRYNKQELLDIAKRFEVKGNLSRKSKAQLAQLLAKDRLDHAHDAIEDAFRWGRVDVECMRDLVEAGGTIRLTKDEVGKRPMPVPRLPYVSYYHDGDDYLLSVPQDLCERLRGSDFEGALKECERIDHLMERLCTLITLYGVATTEELGTCWETDYDVHSPELRRLLTIAEKRARIGDLFADFVFVPEEGAAFVIHEDIAKRADIGSDGTARRPREILDILDARVDKPARPIEDDLPFDTLVRQRSSYRSLCAFLDRRVRDDADDYEYAESIADYIIYSVRAPVEFSDIIDYALYLGPDLDEEEEREFLRLITNLVDDTPQWANYGWSANELDIVWDGPRRRDVPMEPTTPGLPGRRW